MIHRLEILNIRDRYMINDWLMEKDEPFQWESADYCRSSLGMKDITPIPLTEEILLANGFECPFEEGVFEKRSMEYNIFISIKRHCLIIQVHFREIADEARIRIHCNYVHQLQHALRLVGLNNFADNFKVE